MSVTLSRKVARDRSGSNPYCTGADGPPRASGDADAVCGGSEIDFRPPAAEYEGGPAAVESSALLRGLWHSPHRLGIALLASGIVAVLLGNMAGQLRLTSWNGAFFDAVAQRSVDGLGRQLLVFFAIIAGLLTLVVVQTWLQQMLKVRLREWLTEHLLNAWLVPGRPYRLGLAGPIGANPDQRIEEDTRKLTELSASLAVGLLQATLLLISFIGMLWVLSDRLVFVFGGARFTIPGYMVWCAVLYAGIGSLLTWRVGQPLIGLNAELYAKEAELRFALVRVSESAESIGLFGGEQDERRQLNGNLDRVIGSMRQLSGALSRLTWITSGYGWIAIVVPIVVALPGYFSGGLTLGGLMMVVGAFNQVQASLRWFVDQFPSIADWRATLHRVSAFKAAIEKLDEIDKAVDTISLRRERGRHPGIRGRQRPHRRRPSRHCRGHGRYRSRRARADRRRIRDRQEHAVPGRRRTLAMGRRHDPTARSQRNDVHAATAISAARHYACGDSLSRFARRLRHGRRRCSDAARRIERVRASFGSRSAARQNLVAWPAAAHRLRAPTAAPAVLGLPRRGDIRAGRIQSAPGHVDLRPRTAPRESCEHRPSPRARSVPYPYFASRPHSGGSSAVSKPRA